MADTRRLFVKRALTASGGLLAAAFLPSTNYADCKTEVRIIGFGVADVGGNNTYSLSIPDWKLGDCELMDVTITFQGGVGEFKGQVCTHLTHNKDVWHFHLKLIAGNPDVPKSQVSKFEQNWNGPQMTQKDNPLFHTWSERFTYNPAAISFGQLYAQVTSCC